MSQAYPKPYLQFPFDVSRGDSLLEGGFKIVEHRVYQFDLRFEFDAAERDHVAELVGDVARLPDGRYGHSGAVIPIFLKIIPAVTTANAPPVFERQVDAVGEFARELSWQPGARAYLRTIAEVRLPPGLYRYRVNTIKETPSFAGIRTQFVIEYDERMGTLR